MDSRERIIARLQSARRENSTLPTPVESGAVDDLAEKFSRVLQAIGGTVVHIGALDQVRDYLRNRFSNEGRRVSVIDGIRLSSEGHGNDPHQLENVQLAIMKGHFGVAENGAVWITAEAMGDRALPFICEHLALVLRRSDLVETMRHAYTRIGDASYDFGTFIAGPSKTADIEQSLVLGAHGPKTLTLFLLE